MTTEIVFLDLIRVEELETGPPRFRLAVRAYPSDAQGLVFLTPECDSVEGFEQQVRELKRILDDSLQRAREAFQQYRAESEESASTTGSGSVEEIWQTLERCSAVGEMKQIFNPLALATRKEVADFVLTQLNIFKGAASIFSQHYNEEDYLLE